MAEILDNGAELQEEVTFTLAQLKEAGIEDVNKLTAQIQEATRVRKDAVVIDNIAENLKAATEAFTKATQVMAETMTKQAASDQYDGLTREKVVQIFHTLSPEEQTKAKLDLVGEYGARNVGLVLESSNIKAALARPITQSNPQYDDYQAAKKAYDYAYLLTAAWDGVKQSSKSSEAINIDWKLFGDALNVLEKQGVDGIDIVRKGLNDALDTQTATEGLEWLPTILSSTMVDDVYLELRLASLFQRLTMPSKQYELPIRTARGRGYRMPEATLNSQFYSVLAQDHTFETGKITMIAEKLATLQYISDELDQDAVLPVLQMMYQEAVYGMADAIEDAVLNGDTVTTSGHMDTTLWTGAVDARGAWDGLRKLTNTAEKIDFAGAPTTVLMFNLRKKLGKYGATSIDDLVYIIAPETHIELLKIGEVLTMDKYGPNATILRGEIGKFGGIPVVVSPRSYTNLNASGVYDGVTTTKTAVTLVNRRGFVFGDRKLVRVESDRNALAGQRFVLSTWRGDFQKVFPTAEMLVAQGYNVTV